MEEEDKQHDINIASHVQILREACIMLEVSMKICISSVEAFRILLPYCELDPNSRDKRSNAMYKQSSFPIIYSACIFIATKVGEEFKRARDVINVIWYIVRRDELVLEDQQKSGTDEANIDYSDDASLYKYMPQFTLVDYTKVKELVFKVEQHLLRLISFDFQTISAHYYSSAINFVLKLYSKRPKSDNKNICIAMINDIFLIGDDKWRKAIEESIDNEDLFCETLCKYSEQYVKI